MSRGGLALSRGFGSGVRVRHIGRGIGVVTQPLGPNLSEGPTIAVEDRIRLSRDLHDGVLQFLAGAGLLAIGLDDLVANPHHRVQAELGVLHDHADLPAADGAHLPFGQVSHVDAVERQAAGRDATGRAAGLTRRLLAFARRQRLEPKPVDADGLVAGMADLIRRTVGPAIQIEVVGASGL
mgnify:CR=1 FL=1